MPGTIATDQIEFVKELYPRLREDDAAIERYRAAIDRLPPIVVARGRILIDGFHRWQAYRREGIEQIPVEDLGELADVEVMKESVRRNASHGRQLETRDKRTMADKLWRQGVRDEAELADLLSITPSSLETYLRDAKRDDKRAQQEALWDRWLNCEWESYSQAAAAAGITDKTAKAWLSEFSERSEFSEPPESRQHFDVWSFPPARDDSAGAGSYFGSLPPQVIENLLWLWTEPGHVVVDLFAGSGTTIDVAKRMGRRIWASDIQPSTPTLPIHQHDATTGWPADAPRKADLVFLDPPYWRQAAGRYSTEPGELADMDLDAFELAWTKVVKACMSHTDRIAYIVSPAEVKDDNLVVDLATQMLAPFTDEGWHVERRIIVPYSTQQATGQQVEWAREHRRLLKLYRDLVVLTP